MSDIVRNQDPVTLPPSATVREACQSMRDRRVGAVLVTEGDHCLVGIFTGRDAVHRVLAEGKNAAHTTLGEVMTREPDTMPSGKMAIEALRLMEMGAIAVCRSLTTVGSLGLARRPKLMQLLSHFPGDVAQICKTCIVSTELLQIP